MVTLSLESIGTIPFQARASDVKMPQLKQHITNRIMPCCVNVFGTFSGTSYHFDDIPEALFSCLMDGFSDVSNCVIQRPGMLIAQKAGQVSVVG
jgi:hypothetical protein